jgi:integrase
MGLVEIPGSSRRWKRPVILSVDQYFAILHLLTEPYRTIVVVAEYLGFRVSGILAPQWPDINFTELTMRVTRAVVDGVVDEVKTEYSEDDLPLDPDLGTVLLNLKRKCPQFRWHSGKRRDRENEKSYQSSFVAAFHGGGLLVALFCPCVKTSDARNSMNGLVAGGGFEPPTFGL